MVYHVFLLFSFPVKQPNGRKSQPPAISLKFTSMSGPTVKLEKRYVIVSYCATLLREWPTAIQELLPRSSEKGLSRRHDLKNSAYPMLEFSSYFF